MVSTSLITRAMAYKIIQPPFTLNFREMTKKDLKGYFQWLQDVLPQRIEELKEAVTQTSGFEHWQADRTPLSLALLGEWFASQVELRQRTEEELQEAKSRLAFPMDMPEEELTNRTFSLAMDVGMYLSQVFLHQYPSLRWNQEFGSKNYVDYGQPVLSGFGAMAFNPIRMLVTFAYGLSQKKKTGQGLQHIYEIWSEKIKSA